VASALPDRPRDEIRVMVVDDDAPTRALLGELVEATEGFTTVDAAGSGEEALAHLDRRHPDLLLMDVQMPGAGGVATARAASQLPQRPVVVLVSSDDRIDIAADPRAHGAAAFLRKERLSPSTLRRLFTFLLRRIDEITP
jgi:two-component system, NarL family, invasion response regulator UvrY